MNSINITRGSGILEPFLSTNRMKIAKWIIKETNKDRERILDIGCGTYPFFLSNIDFKEKYGIDKEISNKHFKNQNLTLINYDIYSDSDLPFQDNYFDVITLLAVIEHLHVAQMYKILDNCYLLLKTNGILIITTPAIWSNPILKFMSKIGLVSSDELDEHKYMYNLNELNEILLGINFKQKNIKTGYFGFFLNLWAYSIKTEENVEC